LERRIRILYIILGLSIGDPLGGAERLVAELVSLLDQSRFEPVVCAFWHHGTSIERHWQTHLAARGVEVFFATDWHGGHSPAAYAAGLKSVRENMGDRQVDIIHSHFQMGSMMAVLLRRSLGARAIVRTAQAGKEWGDGTAAFLCRQAFTKWVFPLTFDVQTCVSKAGQRRIERYPGSLIARRPVPLIPNGVSIDRFTPGSEPDVRAEFGLLPDDIVVGNVGRLSPEKGHSIFLHATRALLERMPDVKFLVVGDGEQRTALQDQSRRLGLDGSVIWAGARSDVERIYRAMDLFVLPSLWEGLPISILESMASGVPVVASDLPGVRELIRPGQTGWLAEPGNATDLANRMADALSQPEARARVAAEALDQVVPLYSIDGVAEQYGRIYETLARGETGSVSRLAVPSG